MSRTGTPSASASDTAGETLSAARLKVGYIRPLVLLLSIAALLAALWAGLLRLGWDLPALQPELYSAHGPLMVCGFLGTLISIERSVALGKGWSYTSPILCGVGAFALIAGVGSSIGAALITLGSLGLVVNFGAIIRRQAALFTVTMALGAVAWLVGNCLWLAGIPVIRMFFWWTGFLVLTIVGERLELSRLTGLGDGNRLPFIGSTGLFLIGLAIALPVPALGLRMAGLGMLAMALWLLRYDLARRTVRQKTLTRYIAVNLLAGYFWLGVGGLGWLWFGDNLTTFHYDLMLHTVFLGFVFSMIFAHAPIIFPSVTGRAVSYSPVFYLHSVLLHLSLLLRAASDLSGSYTGYRWGGLLNVIAILLFVISTGRAIAREAARSRGFTLGTVVHGVSR